MAATVCLTFDVDAEATFESLPDPDLSSLSHGRYGITRGLPRILDLLDSEQIRATFYVPGMTARRHPDAIRTIVRAGHEVGHHGHRHLSPSACTEQEQRRELVEGLDGSLRVLPRTDAGGCTVVVELPRAEPGPSPPPTEPTARLFPEDPLGGSRRCDERRPPVPAAGG